MHNLAIDIGTYSIKLFEFSTERKWIVPILAKEFILDDYRSKFSKDLSNEELAHKIITQFFEEEGTDYRIIEAIPATHITTRYLSLPVNNRRRALQMIPFQLEDGLPYSMSEAHYDAILEKSDQGTMAMVNIVKKDRFETYLSNIQKRGGASQVLTSEHSLINNFVKGKRENEPFAILDIGHTTTKAYFVYEKKIVATHVAFFGGKNIDEMLMSTYGQTAHEARSYKHINSFFLTTEDLMRATPDQAEFATLMKNLVSSLVTDIKRWDLGLKVKHGISCDHYFIMGGTSQVANINTFLSEELDKPVLPIDLYSTNKNNNHLTSDQQARFGICQLIAYAQISKSELINFLTGEYAGGNGQLIPLHSLVFLTSRTLILSLVFLSILGLEHLLLLKENFALNNYLTKQLKATELEISKKDQALLKKNPVALLKILKKKGLSISQEVNTIMASGRINAVAPLIKLSQLLSPNERVSLIRLEVNEGDAVATFSSDDKDELAATLKQLENASLPGFSQTQNDLTAEVKFRVDL